MAKYTEYKNRRTTDKVYTERQHPNTGFKDKWGIHATDLAKQENVSTESIHMRVMNYGTPFQRRKNPTMCERVHNKTEVELAIELGMHPQSIRVKVRKYGDAYHPGEKTGPNKGVVFGNDWKDTNKAKNNRFWLMPEHENYPHEARKGL